jgi:hypothetical protein
VAVPIRAGQSAAKACSAKLLYVVKTEMKITLGAMIKVNSRHSKILEPAIDKPTDDFGGATGDHDNFVVNFHRILLH